MGDANSWGVKQIFAVNDAACSGSAGGATATAHADLRNGLLHVSSSAGASTTIRKD